MREVVVQFLSKFSELSEVQAKELVDLLNVEEIKKNNVIVSQGQVCDKCYFVLKGCLRQYIITDGVEKTIAFYTEDEAVNYFNDQSTEVASTTFLSSLEDSIVLVGDVKRDQHLFSTFPALEEITRKMIEVDLGKVQHSFAKFKTSSPKDRYLNLLKEKPDLFQRVPQHMIASYLGMTPESLSRIRKRITAK